MNLGALIGFLIGASLAVAAAYRMRAAQIAFLRAYQAKFGLEDPIELGNPQWSNYVATQLRFLVATPSWTVRRLRLLSTRVDDPQVELLRRRFQRRKLLMYASVPLAFALIVLFSAIRM